MDKTTRIIQQKKINTDEATGLDRYAQITKLTIDGENNGLITIHGRNALVSPTGKTMHIESLWSFVRYDKPAIFSDIKVIDSPATYYVAEEDMGNGVLAQGGELKTQEIYHYESQETHPANLKYSMLEQSPIGLGIKQMLGIDLDGAIVNSTWVENNLKQL